MAATMREPTFWILTVLASGPQHGYGLIQGVDRLSRRRLRAGALYAALDRLEAEGLVEPDRQEVIDGRTRRFYRLTRHGSTVLAAETERLRQAAHSRLAAAQPATARLALS
jgi:DNA-binding PadR family transcriptional regulator